MVRKAVSKATKCQIIGMNDGLIISNREIPRKLKILENCVRNTLKILKTTGGIQRQVRANPRLSYR